MLTNTPASISTLDPESLPEPIPATEHVGNRDSTRTPRARRQSIDRRIARRLKYGK